MRRSRPNRNRRPIRILYHPTLKPSQTVTPGTAKGTVAKEQVKWRVVGWQGGFLIPEGHVRFLRRKWEVDEEDELRELMELLEVLDTLA